MPKRTHDATGAADEPAGPASQQEECCICMRDYGDGPDEVQRDTQSRWDCSHGVCKHCVVRLDEQAYECPLCRAPRRDGRVRPTETAGDEAVAAAMVAVEGHHVLATPLVRVSTQTVASALRDLPSGAALADGWHALRLRVQAALETADTQELHDALALAEVLVGDIDQHLRHVGRPPLFAAMSIDGWPRLRVPASLPRAATAPPRRRNLVQDVAELTGRMSSIDRRVVLRVTEALLTHEGMRHLQADPSVGPLVHGDLAILDASMRRGFFRNPVELDAHRTRLVRTLTALAPRPDAYDVVHDALLQCRPEPSASGAAARLPTNDGLASFALPPPPRAGGGARSLGGRAAALVRLVPQRGVDGRDASLPMMVTANSQPILRAMHETVARAAANATPRRRRVL